MIRPNAFPWGSWLAMGGLAATLLVGCPKPRAVVATPDVATAVRDVAVDVIEEDPPPDMDVYEPDPFDDDAYSPTLIDPDSGLADASEPDAGDPDAGPVDTRPMMDRPISEAWPVVNTWSPEFEREYTEFVAALGRGVAERRCNRMDRCLRNPEVNRLYDPLSDHNLHMDIDCADLPYVLRAYFSFKRKLPFGYTYYVVGAASRAGKDPRYMVGIVPSEPRNWWRHRTFRTMLRTMGSWVHSGMYRVSARRNDGDYYTVAVNRTNVRPGTTFYDPNGHVLVVTSVELDGSVFMMDGHPDGSLTSKRFGAAFVAGTYDLGGGFKNFRPVTLVDRQVTVARNEDCPGWDPAQQYTRANFVVEGEQVTYTEWARVQLADPAAVQDPVHEVRAQVQALCSDVTDRVDAVNVALADGLHQRNHPNELPSNIYGTNGDWETYSTPSRDARMKAAFRELSHTVERTLRRDPTLLSRVVTAWREEVAKPECQYHYTNSRGVSVALSFEAVLDRLFVLSFDPYHCPELRWGAAADSPELASCPDDALKRNWYTRENRLRNRIDREYGAPTPVSFGPDEPESVDVRRWFTHPPTASMPDAGAPRR
ncbi:MAG: hypothetical protein Q8Q09_00285 [Deltaproteobacteria bacterium]|nr:hypothetical protein [Deltaproteobacteria bacterium]